MLSVTDKNQQILELGAALSKIAHELRTPLTLIGSTLQIIEAQNPQMKEQKYWSQLTEDVKDMGALITELTTYQSTLTYHPEMTNLYHILDSLITSFTLSSLGENAKITLKSTTKARMAAEQIICDRIQIKQVFTNLIKNALEATKEQDSRIISLSLFFDTPENTESKLLGIKVEDNGPGIPEDILPQIFMPFISGKKSGTGIGLSIAQNIIFSHKGQIIATNRPHGASFVVYLPITEQ